MKSYHSIECPILSCLYAAGISIICIVKTTKNMTSFNYITRRIIEAINGKVCSKLLGEVMKHMKYFSQ
jgi:hypothetical protein